MDLYIQIGVIFLMLAAFSTFTYFYTEPIDTFSTNISESSAEINLNLEKIQNRYLEEFNNNPAVPGTSVETLVKQAHDKGIAVFLQTKNQLGFVVNYGMQMRDQQATAANMAVTGTANGTPTGFESKYVTTVRSLTACGGVEGTSAIYTPGASTDIRTTTNDHCGENYIFLDATSADFLNNRPTGTGLRMNNRYIHAAPKVILAHPKKDVKDSLALGTNYFSTGTFFTDQIVKVNMQANTNYSLMDSPTSMYYLDRNASYYAVIVLDADNEIIGVYVEEHGVGTNYSLAGRAMIKAGLIKALY